MGSKKTTTTTTNNPQFITPPRSPYLDAADQMVDQIDYSTPITQQYGQQLNDINEGGNSVFGASTTPEAADKVRKGRLFAARTQYGEDMSDAVQRTNTDKIQGKLAVAQGYAPTLTNMGSTSVTKQPMNILGGIGQGLQAGVGIASAF